MGNGDFGTLGSGGGGRVAVAYATLAGFDPSRVTALAGAGAVTNSQVGPAGGVGTVYLAQAGQPAQLVIDSHGTPAGAATPLGQTTDTVFAVDNLTVSGAGVYVLPRKGLPIQAGNVSILHGAVLTSLPTSLLGTFPLRLTLTGSLVVDATSKIDVTGLGYPGGFPAGFTLGNTMVGGATDAGSYGGLGGVADGLSTNALYGDPNDPNDVGSGGAGDRNQGGYGGGLVRIAAASATIDGAIVADGTRGIYDGYRIGSGGSGGGVSINVGTLAGSGSISAAGGAGSLHGAGGGGRIAVAFGTLAGFDRTKITAKGGMTGIPGADGTVVIRGINPFAFADAGRPIEHGVVTIRPLVLGADPSLTADYSLSGPTFGGTIATRQPANTPFAFDSTTVPDGVYTLRITFRDASGAVAGTAARPITINNAASYHSGSLTSNETWAAGSVNIVEGPVIVPAGVTLTIAPGGVVKFEAKSSIDVQDGGTLNAPAAPALPVVLTSIRDDSAGGDTNLDGSRTIPEPDDWGGITTEGNGAVNLSASVDLRYASAIHSGMLTADATWLADELHDVAGKVVVPDGVTLTIAAGAIVKFRSLQGIEVQSGGHLIALGTASLPITFSSSKDDTVGGDSNGDGDATTPAPGDWSGLVIDDGGRGRNRSRELPLCRRGK